MIRFIITRGAFWRDSLVVGLKWKPKEHQAFLGYTYSPMFGTGCSPVKEPNGDFRKARKKRKCRWTSYNPLVGFP